MNTRKPLQEDQNASLQSPNWLSLDHVFDLVTCKLWEKMPFMVPNVQGPDFLKDHSTPLYSVASLSAELEY